jgi:hypothetical protein
MPVEWSPTRIIADFEASSLSAVKRIYPDVLLSGCIFHLGQSIKRRIGELPALNARYNNQADSTGKWRMKSLHALAFVPLAHVYSYFCHLASTWGEFEEQERQGKI